MQAPLPNFISGFWVDCGENPTVTELIDYEVFCGAVPQEAQPVG